ncbi:MAG TPA: hypothetical protein VMG12_12030 [Polyangiaceae bacterium]|nr:hypothetical protein [Polyangiaceae bacterium]
MKRNGSLPCRASIVAATLAARAFAAEPEAASASIDAALAEADRRFVAGDLAGALAVLEPACSQSERPACLFSLGAVHHGLGDCPQALAYYRRYRAVAPNGAQIEEVTAALEEVEGRCGEAASALPPRESSVAPEPAASQPEPLSASPSPPPAPAPARAPASGPSLSSSLMVGAFVLSGAAATGSVVFGALAARSAHDCGQARAYDDDFVDECVEDGPRYQRLWQGLALASASFLGIGVTLWWVDSSSSATLGVSGAGTPVLKYRREF